VGDAEPKAVREEKEKFSPRDSHRYTKRKEYEEE